MKKVLLAFAILTSLIQTSCSSDNDSGDNNTTPEPITSITVTSNAANVDLGTSVILTAIGNNNASVSSNSTFYINGNPISGRSYTTTTVGTLDIYATYVNSNGVTLTSPTIQVVVNDVINFNKRVLIEDFTGTWCQFCPRVSYAIELVKAQTSDVVVTAIHRGGTDPYNFSGAGTLEDQIGLSGYPTAMLNRSTQWSYPETATTSINQVINLTSGINPKLGVALETTTTGNTSTVNVKVKFGKNFTNNLKLVVYALEDNLIYDQTNSTTYYGGANPIVNFEHDHVLRAVLTSSILGENITGSTSYNSEFSKSFTYTIPSTVNASNVRFVAFVVDTNNAALNSREAGPNETQSFEIE